MFGEPEILVASRITLDLQDTRRCKLPTPLNLSAYLTLSILSACLFQGIANWLRAPRRTLQRSHRRSLPIFHALLPMLNITMAQETIEDKVEIFEYSAIKKKMRDCLIVSV